MQADDQGWPFTGSGALDIHTVLGLRVLDARLHHSGGILHHWSRNAKRASYAATRVPITNDTVTQVDTLPLGSIFDLGVVAPYLRP